MLLLLLLSLENIASSFVFTVTPLLCQAAWVVEKEPRVWVGEEPAPSLLKGKVGGQDLALQILSVYI